MPLHPIAVVDQVLEEYRSYLLTEFRARDPQLRQALESALERPRFLAQEPFFQAHRPFKSGQPWAALGLDPTLAAVMEQRSGSATAYLHQSDAITHLLGPSAGPMAVTSGTGSGKTECFMLPVIDNAIRDAAQFPKSGLTALLVYPMNALANDQEERIRQYLEATGHTAISVERYDRTTTEAKRQQMRKNPPHILLTNYMMLEYLLVRPADRDHLFANHRCCFVVLDEVHTYRGTLGANIALLFRRLRVHLQHARQDWNGEAQAGSARCPTLIPVATSATIKSVDETGRTVEDITHLRDAAVQSFVATLTGDPPAAFRVIGETLRELTPPAAALWPATPPEVSPPDPADASAVQQALATLAGVPATTALAEAAQRAAILWTLNDLLARRPLSLSGIVATITQQIPERRAAAEPAVRQEVATALVVGAALPDQIPGALRLRTHRFIRGGWHFHRCIDPACGQLYPMGEERCTCGKPTAPLYLCRSCGADALRFSGDPSNPTTLPLEPYTGRDDSIEWLLYRLDRPQPSQDSDDDPFDDGDNSPAPPTAKPKGKGRIQQPQGQLRHRPVLDGSFDPATRQFSTDPNQYPVSCILAPARTRCMVCGATAGSRSVVSPVALGTSAAVRVVAEGLVEGLAEQHRGQNRPDPKERLLIFADSRQDAAHQARFITYAGRYDRMRRRLMQALSLAGGTLNLSAAVQKLMALGVECHDNPHTGKYDTVDYLPQSVRKQAQAWEEAPLLDDLAITAGYRATVFNLGLVGVRYEHLERYVHEQGGGLAQQFGITPAQLLHLCRCLLDDMRRSGALSRPLLQYHTGNPNCPEEFRDADWERKIKNAQGYACDPNGQPVSYLDTSAIPSGIKHYNFWRRPGTGGRGPRIERVLKDLLARMNGAAPHETQLLDLLRFLCQGPRLLIPAKLYGWRQDATLLQINAEAVQLVALQDDERFRCSVCNVRMPWVTVGAPCPACQGEFQPWPVAEVQRNRYVQRILKPDLLPLVACEHTAQITSEERIDFEQDFKAPAQQSPVNVLACSPTLEMGIDVGGLDAVVMRNVPPRPDNYAQRGGRAGRRSRVGVVLGYARATPHDGYFYDKPAEMIAGEVPAPGIGLGNREVILSHLNAIAFGLANPGLAGRMAEYIELQGQRKTAAIDALIDSVMAQADRATALAWEAWGPAILDPAGFPHKEALRAAFNPLPDRIRDLFERVSRQISELETTIATWTTLGRGDRHAVNAMNLKRKLLGIRGDTAADGEADDRTSGHPMRRFAEFGILPGYEFPNEPCTLRLRNDPHEEDPIAVERRFGIAQYQPNASVHARGHRWRVVGLDMASPWNPKSPQPDWVYGRCGDCGLRYAIQHHACCPRCRSTVVPANDQRGLRGHEFGGFIAFRDDTPVLEEEDRYVLAALVSCHPQWNGRLIQRYRLPTGWMMEMREEEEIRWLNEWKPASTAERAAGAPQLHDEARGFYLCPTCGRDLKLPSGQNTASSGGRSRNRQTGQDDPYGHTKECPQRGQPPAPLAITARLLATTLRLMVTLPPDWDTEDYQRWGYSLGYALWMGMRHLFMLDGSELEFELEPMCKMSAPAPHVKGVLTFIDTAVGGSGFLERAAEQFHQVAAHAIEHLDHADCESACYRCLKSYNNQRHHQYLAWPVILPDLEHLSLSAPVTLTLDNRDENDPKPWLDAYAAGVGSPLELKFLRLFEQHGLSVDKQVPVAANAGEHPISVADFVVKGTRTAIYIDGAAFHRGQRLRRDRIIRDKLRNGNLGWRVVVLTAKDLQQGEQLVKNL